MKSEQQNNLDDIRKTINVSSSKNNNSLIFFTIFMLYILISVFGTTDLMLLLPEHMFKMPVINFDLNLIAFYIIAPIMLFMLHFNILFNYNMYLKKIDLQHKKINMNTLDPSMYGYAYNMISRGFDGFLINLFLWVWIYIIPLMILILIYLRFADYHDNAITIFHLVMVLLDIFLIFLSFHYNKIHLKHQQKGVRYLSYVFYVIFTGVFILSVVYHYFIFTPVINDKLDTRIKLGTEQEKCDINISRMYDFIVDKNMSISISSSCFPRLVVNEAEMAKISENALYIPRYMAEKKDINDSEQERQLILNYGARSNLKERNLRYANLYGCILTRADLRHSDLQFSDLRKSHLQASRLTGAKLQHANLMGAKLNKAELQEANLTSTNLSKADIRNLQFTEVTLNNAIIIGTKLENSDFLGANLIGANLARSQLLNGVFYQADFAEANLSHSKLEHGNFNEANLTNANLIHSKLKHGNFINTNLTDANLTYSRLEHSNFTKANLRGANLAYSQLEHSNFTEANLTGANLTYAQLEHSNFTEANLTGANLSHSSMGRSDLSQCNLTRGNLSNANFAGSTFYDAQLNDSNLIEIDLTAATLRNSNLSNTDFKNATLISVDFSGTYTDSNKTNVSLKTVLNSTKEVGGIIIQDIESIDKESDRAYLTDENLTECEQYLTIKLENSDVTLRVTKRKIKYLIKGIEKYINHEGEPNTKCLDVNSTKLSQALQNALNVECQLLGDFIKKAPESKVKYYAQTMNNCKENTTHTKETKDLK